MFKIFIHPISVIMNIYALKEVTLNFMNKPRMEFYYIPGADLGGSGAELGGFKVPKEPPGLPGAPREPILEHVNCHLKTTYNSKI